MCRFFPLSLCHESGRPIRFELRSCDLSSCCCTKRQEWWCCFKTSVNYYSTEEEYSEREEDAGFLLSLVSDVLNIIYINYPLNYVIWRPLSIFFHVRECYGSEYVYSLHFSLSIFKSRLKTHFFRLAYPE